MSWRECTVVSERKEFVLFAGLKDRSVSDLCRRFGVSRVTGYKWLLRDRVGEGLADRSRRPHSSPARTAEATETLVCRLRQEHPAWGGRKLHHYLRREGVQPLPSPSTVNNILRRHGLLDPERREARDWQRFEAEAANRLWQMDFKGPIETQAGPCHALTVLDDYSRFNLCLGICPDQRRDTVQTQLTHAFERYGLPDCLLCDNGPPWGSGYAGQPFTRLAAWLIRRGIAVSHGRPYHPQTQGKDERFHLTLSLELLKPPPVWHHPDELATAARSWRELYNHRRPHEALGNEPPASRYSPSRRAYSPLLEPIEYPPADLKRIVQQDGHISFRGRQYLVGRAFASEPVALRAVGDGLWEVYYCFQRVSRIDLSSAKV